MDIIKGENKKYIIFQKINTGIFQTKRQSEKNNIPYYTQKKQHLIYVDIIEHAILHKLIAIEAGEELVNSVSKGIIGRATDVEEIKPKNSNI